MYTHKDIECRTIFVINCINERDLHVSNGELVLDEADTEIEGKRKTLTKMPFQKILALFIVGHIRVTTPLIEKCKKYNVALIVMKPNLRPVFYWSDSAEANFLLRRMQYNHPKDDLAIAKRLISNKISNQVQMLENTRKKDELTLESIRVCRGCQDSVNDVGQYEQLLGIEGLASKHFFTAYYQDLSWSSRKPRCKCDELNVTLDIGYTILFNFIECFLRMFGFDLYIGVYHRLWFKRKSLVCDVMEPFRCIIDRTVRTCFHRKQFDVKHFSVLKNEYVLKREYNSVYYQAFYDALIPYKTKIFIYVQSYYRNFMKQSAEVQYPFFNPSC